MIKLTIISFTLTLFLLPISLAETNLKSKSFIGTFGFPASGNIWMQEMLRFTDGVSTIHAGCAAKHGANTYKQCTNSQFSAFAQSATMGRKGAVDLKIGVMCTLETTPEIVKQTSRFITELVAAGLWNVNDSYFVESSTKLALRLPLLKQAANIFGDQKYIISIKHPICVSGGFDSGSWVEAAAKQRVHLAFQDLLILVDVDGVKVNQIHRGNTLCEGYDSHSRGTSWIQFMNILHTHLKEDEEWSLKHVRIVRYEDFQSRPIQLCQNLFKFLFTESHEPLRGQVTNKSSPYFWTERDIQHACEGLFPKVVSPQTRHLRHASGASSARHLSKYVRTPLMNQNYHLATSLNYNPLLINETCSYAMTQFQEAYHLFPDDIKTSLEQLSVKMEPYGYTLNPAKLFATDTSVLEKWNLMK